MSKLIKARVEIIESLTTVIENIGKFNDFGVDHGIKAHMVVPDTLVEEAKHITNALAESLTDLSVKSYNAGKIAGLAKGNTKLAVYGVITGVVGTVAFMNRKKIKNMIKKDAEEVEKDYININL